MGRPWRPSTGLPQASASYWGTLCYASCPSASPQALGLLSHAITDCSLTFWTSLEFPHPPTLSFPCTSMLYYTISTTGILILLLLWCTIITNVQQYFLTLTAPDLSLNPPCPSGISSIVFFFFINEQQIKHWYLLNIGWPWIFLQDPSTQWKSKLF